MRWLVILLAAGGMLAQDWANVRQELQAKYFITTATSDKADIVTAGDVLVLRVSNLVAVAVDSKYPNQNRYINGHITQGGLGVAEVWLKVFSKDTKIPDRTFVKGEKLWLTGIDLKEAGVTLTLLSDLFDNVRYEAKLDVPFEQAREWNAHGIAARLDEVFAVEHREQEVRPSSSVQPSDPPADAGSSPSGPPKMIRLGQTPAEVRSLLGSPSRITNDRSTQIYEYDNLRIIFKAGKVADAQ